MAMLKTKTRTKNSGFTLIELLVVVSIIALLVSILLPALSKAREHAKQVVCATNEHSMGQALIVYAHDHNDRYPLAGYEVNQYLRQLNEYSFRSWKHGALYDLYANNYITDLELFFCPSSQGQGSPQTTWPSSTTVWPTDRYWGNYAYFATSKKIALHISNNYDGRITQNSNGLTSPPIALVGADLFLAGYATFAYRYNHRGVGANTLYNDGRVEWNLAGALSSGTLYNPQYQGIYLYSMWHSF